MNNTFNATSCAVQITGWCEFSQGAQAGIILGFIALIVVGCCCYCLTVQEKKLNIYR
jgi:hypothetical protein